MPDVFKQLPIDEQSKANLVKARVNIFFDSSDELADQLFSGRISIGQWQESMKQLIRETHTSCAAIGAGGWDEMTFAKWGRLGTPLREQYAWLHGFSEFISENRDTISLAAIKARARLYGEGAGGSTVLMQAWPDLVDFLPYLPKDGSSPCLNRCHCLWRLSVDGVQSDGSQEVMAIWELGVAEHCNVCVERDGVKVSFVTPPGVVIPDIIGGI